MQQQNNIFTLYTKSTASGTNSAYSLDKRLKFTDDIPASEAIPISRDLTFWHYNDISIYAGSNKIKSYPARKKERRFSWNKILKSCYGSHSSDI
jgi:hypothetical protein